MEQWTKEQWQIDARPAGGAGAADAEPLLPRILWIFRACFSLTSLLTGGGLNGDKPKMEKDKLLHNCTNDNLARVT